eukprot:scaffold7729_cov88-Skeletonema_dohrnii-CCMP3373.AAC.1
MEKLVRRKAERVVIILLRLRLSGFVNKCTTHALLMSAQPSFLLLFFDVVLRCGLEILIPTLEPFRSQLMI